MVLLHIVGFDRPEGPETHMQRHVRDMDAHRLDFPEQFLRKMQPRRRRRRRSFIFRVDRVVARPVLKLVVDVGRQRHLPERVQHLLENALIVKLHQPVPLIDDIDDLADERSLLRRPVRAAEEDPGADPAFFARLHQRLPGIRALPGQEQDLHLSEAPLANAEKARRDHLGVVDHQGVAGLKVRGDVFEAVMPHLAGFAAQVQQPRG